MHEKLDALSFVDRRIDPVVTAIRQWLARLPATGPIEGQPFLEGWALMRLVSDAETMARHGAGLLALDALMPSHDNGPASATAVSPPTIADNHNAGESTCDFDALFEATNTEFVDTAADATALPLPAQPAAAPTEPTAAQDFWF